MLSGQLGAGEASRASSHNTSQEPDRKVGWGERIQLWGWVPMWNCGMDGTGIVGWVAGVEILGWGHAKFGDGGACKILGWGEYCSKRYTIEELHWDHAQFLAVQAKIAALAAKHVKVASFNDQDTATLKIVYAEAVEAHPILLKYDGHWVTKDMLKIHLKNKKQLHPGCTFPVVNGNPTPAGEMCPEVANPPAGT
ncbi:uncharacterized protein C8Q71DRAFT_726619 [Rhodofomes roseus]|uniref:Uncharacterized protein n=1 Tax=Rhodofomes roseus TaxID=34475 RepID=A0ABQ8K488_9APHY|nr:uncharacterized protein C8Q71DRAFT_726619 [Rhodofomes roseus]KAH9831725.1 hypothetical protein C8Q71DRAFT_726619 [Rhodofomes roseus]